MTVQVVIEDPRGVVRTVAEVLARDGCHDATFLRAERHDHAPHKVGPARRS